MCVKLTNNLLSVTICRGQVDQLLTKSPPNRLYPVAQRGTGMKYPSTENSPTILQKISINYLYLIIIFCDISIYYIVIYHYVHIYCILVQLS